MPKRTGIVRRMDDLGRIVFPKELRRQLGLEEGAPLELGIGETEDGQKYLYAAPYKSSQDAFKEFAAVGKDGIFHIVSAFQPLYHSGQRAAEGDAEFICIISHFENPPRLSGVVLRKVHFMRN